jgi:hypothetical protein
MGLVENRSDLTPLRRSVGCAVAGRLQRDLDSAVVAGLRYAGFVAATLDRDKLHDVLDQAVLVIDAKDLERSRRDPRVRALHESAANLLAELEAEGADYS